MITRSRIFITAALVCHLLLASGIVTSQTLPPAATTVSAPESAAVPDLPTAPVGQTEEPVTMRAVQQEKEGSIYHLRGAAEIDYRTYILRADQITYNADTGDSEEEGHVVLDGGPYDEHIVASHGTYNIRTQIGTFYSAIGTVGFQMRYSRYVLTTSNPFAFTGKIVEKHGPDHYLVRYGTVTTCELPHPKWLFNAGRMVVDVDGTAKIYNSDFRLMGLPVFYFPFVEYPAQKEQRHTGLLIPSFGNSSTRGLIAGESVYWAFNRSTDATLGAEYYSKRGWFQRAELRARPSDSSFVFFNYVGIVDRGIGDPLAESRRRGRAFSCRALFWELPRRRECRLFEFVRFPHCLHRCVHAGDRFGSAVADFSFQYDQRISLQCTGGTLPEFRSLQSEHATECDLHHDHADGTGPDSAYAKFLHFWRGAAAGKYAAVLVVRERGRGFAAARGARRFAAGPAWVSHWSAGGQVRSGAFARDAAAMAGMVVSSRTYAAGYVLHRAGQPGNFRQRLPTTF